jgi:GNAT superfamily N-acetyltransferase
MLIFLDTIIIVLLAISLIGLYYLYRNNDNDNNIIIKKNPKNFSDINNEIIPKIVINDNIIEKLELDKSLIDRKKYENKLCKFKDDTGYVCPIHYKKKNNKIIPYQESTKEIQDKVCKFMIKEWAEEAKINNVDDAHYYIIDNWSSGDILYVLIDDIELLGFIAVDRKQFYPFISHLYVTPDNRKKGFGKLLIDFAIEYIKILDFSEGKLWCKEELVPFYEKYGWKVIDKKKLDAIVMSKNI